MAKFIFDSSALISVSERCMLKLLENIATGKGIEFLIPQSVYSEVVETPLKIKRFEFNAVRIKDLVERGLMKVAEHDAGLDILTKKVLGLSNSIFSSRYGSIQLMHFGEAEALALMKKTNADAFVIDERTTREIIENPEGLRKFISERRHTGIDVNKAALSEFQKEFGGCKIARSTELAAFAYENNLFGDVLPRTREAIESLLYALRYAGCAVSVDEIKEYLGSANT